MDRKARKLDRLMASGDPDAGVRLAHIGVRTGNADYLAQGLLSSLDILGYDELQGLQHAVGGAIARKVEEGKSTNPKSFGAVKAVEFNLSTLGKVSIGELVHSVGNFVDLVRTNPAEAVSSPFLYRSNSGYNRRSAKACIAAAEDVFSKYKGDYFVSSSGALRIYALKRDLSPDEKERRKAILQRRQLEKELVAHEAKRSKLVQQLEKQQRSQARLKARLDKMDIDG
jgi:hypothetical protein